MEEPPWWAQGQGDRQCLPEELKGTLAKLSCKCLEHSSQTAKCFNCPAGRAWGARVSAEAG